MTIGILQKYLKKIRRAVKIKQIVRRSRQIGAFALTHKTETKFLLDRFGRMVRKGAEYGHIKGISRIKTKCKDCRQGSSSSV